MQAAADIAGGEVVVEVPDSAVLMAEDSSIGELLQGGVLRRGQGGEGVGEGWGREGEVVVPPPGLAGWGLIKPADEQQHNQSLFFMVTSIALLDPVFHDTAPVLAGWGLIKPADKHKRN